MRTKILLFLLMVVCSLPLFSETQPTPYRSYFGKEFTHWYVYSLFLDIERGQQFSIQREDSILSNGRSYKQLWEGEYHPLYYAGLREDIKSGSLYFCRDGKKETLVSCMDLKVGDKYRFSFSVEKFNKENFDHVFKEVSVDDMGDYATVDSIFYKDGRKHIRLDAVYLVLDHYVVPLTFIEGIGPNISFSSMAGTDIWFDVCFNCYENEGGLWKVTEDISGVDLSDEENCSFSYANIREMEANFRFKLIRREGEIALVSDQIEGIGVGRVYLYAIKGEIIFSKPVQENASIIIPTSGLASGSYVVRFVEEKTKKGWSRTVVL